jgi:hypothetical protein
MLQDIALEPFVAAMIALAGTIVGLGIGFLVLPGQRRIKKLEEELGALRSEYAEYRSRVGTHFQTTGRLIGEMTASYKAVYDHLADGAQVLCSGASLGSPVFAAPRLILSENLEVRAEGVRATPQAAVASEPASAQAENDAVALKEAALDAAPRVETQAEGVNGSARDDVRFA